MSHAKGLETAETLQEKKSLDTSHIKHLSESDSAIEKRILRKLDIQLIPILWVLFLVSFVDRGNIGNAKIQGLDESLKLIGNEYNIAVMVFTLAYVVFGLPATMLFKKFGPKSLCVMMFAWAITVIGQGLTKSYAGLVACRFLTGACEAGFVPGCAYLIGSYYKRDEFLKRYAVFFSAGIIAGAFNGLFANLLARLDGVGGYAGWRWILIVEGLITVVASFGSYVIIPSFPAENNRTFTAEEKMVLLARLEADGGNVINDPIKLWPALTDWKIWIAIIIYFGVEENASSVVAFQPTVLKGLGYTAGAAQVHSIPIFVVAFVASIACAVLSERLGQRFIFGMLGVIIGITGVAIELAQPKAAGVRYMGMFFVTTGAYVVMPLTVVWLAINLGQGYKRTIGLGLLIPVGNCGAFVSSNVFITNESPTYRTGFRVGIAFYCISAAALLIMYVGLRVENGRRDGVKREDAPPCEGPRVEDLGERHPDFRYAL